MFCFSIISYIVINLIISSLCFVFQVIDTVEGFSHIDFNYALFPPIRIKTKPQLFILKRLPGEHTSLPPVGSTELPIDTIADVSEEEMEVEVEESSTETYLEDSEEKLEKLEKDEEIFKEEEVKPVDEDREASSETNNIDDDLETIAEEDKNNLNSYSEPSEPMETDFHQDKSEEEHLTEQEQQVDENDKELTSNISESSDIIEEIDQEPSISQDSGDSEVEQEDPVMKENTSEIVTAAKQTELNETVEGGRAVYGDHDVKSHKKKQKLSYKKDKVDNVSPENETPGVKVKKVKESIKNIIKKYNKEGLDYDLKKKKSKTKMKIPLEEDLKEEIESLLGDDVIGSEKAATLLDSVREVLIETVEVEDTVEEIHPDENKEPTDETDPDEEDIIEEPVQADLNELDENISFLSLFGEEEESYYERPTHQINLNVKDQEAKSNLEKMRHNLRKKKMLRSEESEVKPKQTKVSQESEDFVIEAEGEEEELLRQVVDEVSVSRLKDSRTLKKTKETEGAKKKIEKEIKEMSEEVEIVEDTEDSLIEKVRREPVKHSIEVKIPSKGIKVKITDGNVIEILEIDSEESDKDVKVKITEESSKKSSKKFDDIESDAEQPIKQNELSGQNKKKSKQKQR